MSGGEYGGVPGHCDEDNCSGNECWCRASPKVGCLRKEFLVEEDIVVTLAALVKMG